MLPVAKTKNPNCATKNHSRLGQLLRTRPGHTSEGLDHLALDFQPDLAARIDPAGQHDALGADLVEGLRGQGATIYGKGNMSIDLTQTSYSTIPSVDMELGNAYSDHSDAILDQLAEGLLQGINVYFQQQ